MNRSKSPLGRPQYNNAGAGPIYGDPSVAPNNVPWNQPQGEDTVPAMLTPGEFVLNAEATEMFHPQIQAMNEAGKQQHMQKNGNAPIAGRGPLTQQQQPRSTSGIQKVRKRDRYGNETEITFDTRADSYADAGGLWGVLNDWMTPSTSSPTPPMPEQVPALNAGGVAEATHTSNARTYVDWANKGDYSETPWFKPYPGPDPAPQYKPNGPVIKSHGRAGPPYYNEGGMTPRYYGLGDWVSSLFGGEDPNAGYANYTQEDFVDEANNPSRNVAPSAGQYAPPQPQVPGIPGSSGVLAGDYNDRITQTQSGQPGQSVPDLNLQRSLAGSFVGKQQPGSDESLLANSSGSQANLIQDLGEVASNVSAPPPPMHQMPDGTMMPGESHQGGQPQQQQQQTSVYDTIAKHEGFRDEAYDDGTGVWTIGYGRITNPDGSRVQPGQTTSREAEQPLFKARVDEDTQHVLDYAKKYGYNWRPDQITALTSFTYNLGKGGLDKLTAGGSRSDDEIMSKLPEYNKAGGNVLPGLQNRRNDEAALFGGYDQAGLDYVAPSYEPDPQIEAQRAALQQRVDSGNSFQRAVRQGQLNEFNAANPPGGVAPVPAVPEDDRWFGGLRDSFNTYQNNVGPTYDEVPAEFDKTVPELQFPANVSESGVALSNERRLNTENYTDRLNIERQIERLAESATTTSDFKRLEAMQQRLASLGGSTADSQTTPEFDVAAQNHANNIISDKIDAATSGIASHLRVLKSDQAELQEAKNDVDPALRAAVQSRLDIVNAEIQEAENEKLQVEATVGAEPVEVGGTGVSNEGTLLHREVRPGGGRGNTVEARGEREAYAKQQAAKATNGIAADMSDDEAAELTSQVEAKLSTEIDGNARSEMAEGLKAAGVLGLDGRGVKPKDVDKLIRAQDPSFGSKVLGTLSTIFKDMFGSEDITQVLSRGLIMYLGGRATGLSGNAALALAAKDGLNQGSIQNQEFAQREQFALSADAQQYVPSSVKDYVKSGNIADLVRSKAGIAGFGDYAQYDVGINGTRYTVWHGPNNKGAYIDLGDGVPVDLNAIRRTPGQSVEKWDKTASPENKANEVAGWRKEYDTNITKILKSDEIDTSFLPVTSTELANQLSSAAADIISERPGIPLDSLRVQMDRAVRQYAKDAKFNPSTAGDISSYLKANLVTVDLNKVALFGDSAPQAVLGVRKDAQNFTNALGKAALDEGTEWTAAEKSAADNAVWAQLDAAWNIMDKTERKFWENTAKKADVRSSPYVYFATNFFSNPTGSRATEFISKNDKKIDELTENALYDIYK